jgi:hypothetical protein
MKRLTIKKAACIILAVGMMISCRDEAKYPIDFDQVNASNGAYVRTIDLKSSKFNLTQLSTAFYEAVYEAGVADKNKFESVDIFVSLTDVTKDNGTTERDEVKLANIPASMWTVDAESGLPRFNYKVMATDIYSALNLTESDVSFGDIFTIRESINYNGVAFSVDNVSADLSGGPFYSSPFEHEITTADPLFITLTWDGDKNYCKTVDLDLYVVQVSSGKEVTGYAAATAKCPEVASPKLSLANGDYQLLVQPWAHGLSGSNQIPVKITLSREDREDIVLDYGTIDTADPIWSDNDGADEYLLIGTLTKSGIDFDVKDKDGNDVGTMRKINFSAPREVVAAQKN